MSLVKILLVEDDDILAEVYMLKFKLEGLDAKHAPNGAEALASVTKFKPDLILLDLMMPVMDGWEFMTRLKQTDIQALVIVFSNMLSKETTARATKLGATATWSKSDFTPEMAIQQIFALHNEHKPS